MSIDGTSGNDTLNGTTGPDIINGFAGNDIINGSDGNDTITGGDGNDTLSGGIGDDLFIEDTFTAVDTFDGGTGIDTIEVRAVATPILTSTGLISPHGFFVPNALVSIERLVFGSKAGEQVQASMSFGAASALTEVVGGAGRDSLVMVAGASGVFTMPALNLTGFSVPALNAWDNVGDSVILVASPPPNGVITLNASNSLNAYQVLVALGGTVTLNGSANGDLLVAGTGTDLLLGNGGNDLLSISNVLGQSNTFFGASLDGGSGIDLLTVGGMIHFLGTLSNIEGVNFQPAFNSPNPASSASIPPAVLEIDSTRLAMLPANAFFSGTGTVQVDVSNGTGFNGTQYTFVPGSNVSFDIIGEDGNGLSYVGTSANDTIEFGVGVQSATGGAGADVFRPSAGNRVITDFTPGVDKIDLSQIGLSDIDLLGQFVSEVGGSTVLSITFGGVVNTLTLQGVPRAALSAGDVILADPNASVTNFGTEAADVLFGGAAGDFLRGFGGDDVIFTGGGMDNIDAGAGNDTVVITGPVAPGAVITGGADSDTLLLTAKAVTSLPAFPGVNFELLVQANVSGFETISFDSSVYGVAATPISAVMGVWQFAPGSTTTLKGSTAADAMVIVLPGDGAFDLPSFNLVNWSAADSVVLSGTNRTGNLTLGTANHLGQYYLLGGLGNDILNGSAGVETLNGGDGNDTLNGGAGSDTHDGGNGIETASYADASGSVKVNLLWTSAQNTGAAAGSDKLVSIENLIGSGFADQLTGNSADNRIEGLDGNDRLDGGLGADTLLGGIGDDRYTVDNAGDVLIENAGEGVDSVYTSISYSLDTNLETLTLTGTGNLDGTGNELANTLTGNAGDNHLTGLDGNDKLNGGLGADTMVGGIGNDSYTVDNVGDVITENADEGIDSVSVSFSYTLGANLEKLTLSGTANLDGTGNELANTLTGNTGDNHLSGFAGKDSLSGDAGNDVLTGGLAGDTLTGGAGADQFVFDVLETAANKDTIKDFEHGLDHIMISRSAFAAFGLDPAGALNPGEFALGTAATTASQHLIYNQATGALFYDDDGSGAHAKIQIATLSTKPVIDVGDFLLV